MAKVYKCGVCHKINTLDDGDIVVCGFCGATDMIVTTRIDDHITALTALSNLMKITALEKRVEEIVESLQSAFESPVIDKLSKSDGVDRFTALEKRVKALEEQDEQS